MKKNKKENPKLLRAECQRFIGLQSAFHIIDAFAIPSLSPKELDNYLKVKHSLIRNYVKNIGSIDLRNYRSYSLPLKKALKGRPKNF